LFLAAFECLFHYLLKKKGFGVLGGCYEVSEQVTDVFVFQNSGIFSNLRAGLTTYCFPTTATTTMTHSNQRHCFQSDTSCRAACNTLWVPCMPTRASCVLATFLQGCSAEAWRPCSSQANMTCATIALATSESASTPAASSVGTACLAQRLLHSSRCMLAWDGAAAPHKARRTVAGTGRTVYAASLPGSSGPTPSRCLRP
jgi:hypothetical protein